MSAERSGNPLLLRINSIFNVFTYLYSSYVKAKAHGLFCSEFCFSLHVYVPFYVFLAVFNELVHHLSGSMSEGCLQPY